MTLAPMALGIMKFSLTTLSITTIRTILTILSISALNRTILRK